MTVEESSMSEIVPPGDTVRKRPAEELEENLTQAASQSTQEALGELGTNMSTGPHVDAASTLQALMAIECDADDAAYATAVRSALAKRTRAGPY
eukprot:8534017-Karenia_brevis.AAC.1